MKIIVKVAAPLGCTHWRGRFSFPAPLSTENALPIRRKSIAGFRFELGVRVTRVIIAEKRVGLMAMGGRALAAALKIVSHFCSRSLSFSRSAPSFQKRSYWIFFPA
ncbi:hypothetical protein J2Z66_000006 [Paenibacillus eucommiae]|uniref:Uncharacterized protein n=1 Tax=Paenibacillus eucommiae TaxID=1355755 RepID=A0ABS4IN02_9BACL|nr:hypothetical protein [Paenibacillus eucommiae]